MKILKKHRRAAAWAVALAAAAFAAYYFFLRGGELPVEYRTAEVERRDMLLTIDATGTVEPEDLVNVGARVSGEIVSFGKDNKGKEVDYGSEISEGAVIALIDDEIQKSNLLQAEANLERAKASQKQARANLNVAEANLRQAERNWKRAKALGVSEALSQASYDSYLSAWEQATAEIGVAQAQILSADAEVMSCEADVKLERRNLSYCVIKAPVDGVVIDRIVSVGQTVVSTASHGHYRPAFRGAGRRVHGGRIPGRKVFRQGQQNPPERHDVAECRHLHSGGFDGQLQREAAPVPHRQFELYSKAQQRGARCS